jgi:hypothetical protein
MNSQQQHQQHPDVNSRHASKGMPEILEMPTTVLASAGMPTGFRRNLRKIRQNGKTFVKKEKRVKIPNFGR